MSDAIKTVLVATDGSESALRAEAVAIKIAAGCGSRLVVVTISRGLPEAEIRHLAHTEGDVSKARHALIRRILDAAKERAEGAGVNEVCLVSEHGDPAKVILSVGEREQADVVVIGRRGVGAISKLLLGSVSKSIIDNAHCAITVVP